MTSDVEFILIGRSSHGLVYNVATIVTGSAYLHTCQEGSRRKKPCTPKFYISHKAANLSHHYAAIHIKIH